jgi:hypothetical protein
MNLKDNLFNILYLILLIALLVLIANKRNTINDDTQTLTETEQLVKENE